MLQQPQEKIMAKKSPLQQVRDEYGSKAELAKKVLGFLEAPEGEDAEDFQHRVETMSNAKLLRLQRSYDRIQSDYGSKAALAEKITRSEERRVGKECRSRWGREH